MHFITHIYYETALIMEHRVFKRDLRRVAMRGK